MDRITLGPTPTTYSVVRNLNHDHLTCKPGDEFTLLHCAKKKQLSSALKGGAICEVKPLPFSDTPISVSWNGLEAVAGAKIPVAVREAITECHRHGLIGVSQPMLTVIKDVAEASTLDKPVLVAGASRNGQEEAARCIHQLSERASQGLIEIDCDGARVDLVHAAFKRASQTAGALDTIWVRGLDKAPRDVMSVVSHGMQRRGVVVSVHRSLKDLQLAARDGELREDLLSVFNMGIELPPLGRRLGDVPLLVYYVIARHNRGDFGSPRQAIETVTLQSLYVASRCLNVSQLEWTVKEGCRRAQTECLDLDMTELEDTVNLPADVDPGERLLLKDEELLWYDMARMSSEIAVEAETLDPTGGRDKADDEIKKVTVKTVEPGPDYKWVRVNGVRYPTGVEAPRDEFTPRQSEILRYLHDQWDQGKDELTYEEVDDALERSAGKLAYAFKSRPGTWGKDGLLGPGNRKGTVRLNI